MPAVKAPRSRQSGGQWFSEVEGLRALAALSVILTHVSFEYAPSGNKLLNFITQNNEGPPAPSVLLFFMVSGFVMYLPFATNRFNGKPAPDLVSYAIRRFARIAPAYWVALALVGIWLKLDYLWHPGGFIRYFGFLQIYGNLHTLGGGIGPAWTLCVELTFYIALPGLAWIARRLGQRYGIVTSEVMLVVGMIAVSEIFQFLLSTFVSFGSGYLEDYLITLPGTLDVFGVGMLLAVLSVEGRHRAQPRRIAAFANRYAGLWWVVAGALIFAVEQIPEHIGPRWWWLSTHALKVIAVGMMLTPLVLGRQRHGPLRAVLAIRPLVWIGTLTYGIYLWHYPILLKEAHNLVPHGMLYATVVLAIWAIIFGALSFYLIERPAQRLARRIIASRGRSSPPPSPAETGVPLVSK
jgi:peptidoglycan/LPS O-acetylase OafA/YrhL